MALATVSISIKDDLLQEIDELAMYEASTRSELFNRAAEIYMERKTVSENNVVKSRNRTSLNDILKLRGKYAGYISVEKFLEQKRKDIELE